MEPRGPKYKFKMPWVVRRLRGSIRLYIKTCYKYSRLDDKKQNKKVLGAFNGTFETFTRNYKKKKFLGPETVKGMTQFKTYARYS